MSNKIKWLFFTFFLMDLSFCIFAQERTKITLTVEDAVQKALENHIDIKRSEIDLNQTKREYNHSWNNILPGVSASATGSKSQYYQDADTDTTSLQAGVSANLSLDMGLAAKIKGLKASYESGKLSYEDTVKSTENAVRQSFYNLLYLKAKVDSAQTTLNSYQRQYDQTREKSRRGVASELDLLTSQVNLETAKPDVDSAEMDYINALIEFSKTIGIWEEEVEVEITGSLDYANTAKTIDHTVLDGIEENSSEIKELEAQLKVAEYSRSSTFYSSLFPSLNLSGTYYPEYYIYDNNASSSTDTPNWSISLGLSLSLDNLLPGSSARDSISKLDDTIEDYKLQLEDKKKSVKIDAIEKLKKIELSQKTLKTRQLNVELAQKSYDMTEEAYNRGTKDLLTLQSALDTLQSAELQLKSEQYNLICNILDLENTLGVPFDTFFNSENAE